MLLVINALLSNKALQTIALLCLVELLYFSIKIFMLFDNKKISKTMC